MRLFDKIKKYFYREDPGQLKRELAWLWSHVRRYRGRILLCGLLGLGGTVMSLISGVASKYLIDAVTGHGSHMLGRAAMIMVLTMLAGLVLQGISSRTGASTHVHVKNEMQHMTYGRILRAGWEALEPYRSGDLLSRLNTDVNVVSEGVIGFLPALASAGVKFLGAFCIMLCYDPTMAVIALLGVPAILAVSRMSLRKMHSHNQHMKELTAEVMSFQEDSFRNLTSIKAFALADRFEDDLHRLQGNYAHTYLTFNAFQIGLSSFLSLVSMAVTASCFGWGVYRLWSGRITYGSLTLFLELAGTLRGSFSSLVSLAQQAVSLTTSAGRILAVEALPAEQKAVPDGLIQETGLNMELSQVSFRYCTGETVLEPFAFTANHGDLIAVTGPSGEGKTTLLRLLLGLVEPDTGRAELVGSSGKRYPLDAGTRQVFAYVPQGSSVFSGTIAENLRLVRPDASEEELEEVLRIACAWEFVNCLPGGLHHRLGAGGRGVSEGQAQRLAIARALLRRAPVLLLDEATSGLDIATERKLMKNLKESGRLQTCILVTHRPESARFCNRTYEIRRRHVTEVTDEA